MPQEPDIAAELRRADPDRYLSVLYASQASRAALFALYAFNVEIASVRDRIHDPMPGEIRLQWWRDAIDSTSTEAAAGHPLASGLMQAIARHELPPGAFDNYIEARIFDLYNDPMPSRTDLEGYCGETASALIQLSALVLDKAAAPSFAELAGHAGCAQAIAGLLRLLPLHRARGQCYVPAEILAASGLSVESLLNGGDNAALGRAVAAMTALAREHLTAFLSQAGDLPLSLRPAFLPVALTGAYLDAIDRKGFKAAHEVADIPGWKRHWLLFRAASRGF
ncbi:MAG: phytoene/squalene synthase family protein [Rhizobiaceae bacterium]|nr:phytoene/squalene synthase family protein [Rhizobiaceae bacterium]